MTDHYKRFDTSIPPREKYGPRFTAADVYDYREKYSCGMMEAKEKLIRKQILEDLDKGRRSLNTALLYDILEYMIENRYV